MGAPKVSSMYKLELAYRAGALPSKLTRAEGTGLESRSGRDFPFSFSKI